MKRTPKNYQELLQKFKDLIIEEYGLDEPDEDFEEEDKLFSEKLIEKIQTASNFKEVTKILREEELDDVIGIVDNVIRIIDDLLLA